MTVSASAPINPSSHPGLTETPLAAVRTLGMFPPFAAPNAPTLTANQDRLASAVRHHRPQQGQSQAGPSSKKSKHIASTKTALKCAIIPFTVSISVTCNVVETYMDIYTQNGTDNAEARPINIFKHDLQHSNELLMQLTDWGLVFDVAYQDESALAWQLLDQQITNHLGQQGITIVAPPNPVGQVFLDLSWSFCSATRAGVAGLKNYISYMPPEYACTIERIRLITWPHPCKEGYSVFFVG